MSRRLAPAHGKREGPERAHRLAEVQDELPLYPSENQIAQQLLGPGCEAEWRALAIVLERYGLPMIDAQTGRRFWPALVAFFFRRFGLGDPASTGSRVTPAFPASDPNNRRALEDLAQVRAAAPPLASLPRRRRGPRSLPLFPSEVALADHLLGDDREGDWAGMATVLQRHGLPEQDPIVGRRFWPDVVAYFFRRAGLGNMIRASALTDNQEHTSRHRHPLPDLKRPPPPPARKPPAK